MASVDLPRALDPSYVSALETLPLAEVRARRVACTELETDLSYLRRLVQGRIDIIVSESHRRELGESSGDIGELVERLPQILSDHLQGPGAGRLSTLMAPGEERQSSLLQRLDAAMDPKAFETLPDLDATELGQALERLSQLEQEVSAERRALHDILDRLQEEIVRRYRSGEASVDSLLG